MTFLRAAPELDFVAVGVDEPAEFVVVVGLRLAGQLGAASLGLAQGFVQVVDNEVEYNLYSRGRNSLYLPGKPTSSQKSLFAMSRGV